VSGTWVVVVAGGRGDRYGEPKQFVALGERRVVDWSLLVASRFGPVVAVLPPDRVDDPVVAELASSVVAGGSSRSASVRAGLDAVPAGAEHVLVHDAARPLASAALFERVLAALRAGAEAVVPVVPVTDTVRQIEPSGTSLGSVVDRSRLCGVQTPQGFVAGVLRAAHARGGDATDDAGLVEAMGIPVHAVEGERWNLKITEPGDAAVAAALMDLFR
jgi:2-C-methyl-D-erythritol 4-phosphate cytidylyltransferase